MDAVNKNGGMTSILAESMAKLREMVDVNTVVGEPIVTADGVTLIPVSKVSVGFGNGGTDFNVKSGDGFGGGSAAGVKIDPIGFLIVQNGNVRMLNILPAPATTMDRFLEMLPSMIDKIDELNDKRLASKQAETEL